MINVILNIVSISIGALITWIVARRYYVRAALDLESETKKIRNLLRVVLISLEDEKMVKLTRDSSGEIIGLAHDFKMRLKSSTPKIRAVFDVTKKDQDTQ